jgi:Secretion system C-terminal sorting domain
MYLKHFQYLLRISRLQNKKILSFSTPFFILVIQLIQLNAQTLSLQDTTISSKFISSADSITIGPNFAITSTGETILTTEKLTIIPQFFIIRGGKFTIVNKGNPVSIEKESPAIPSRYMVFQNFPNPFNPETRISFALPERRRVLITIYNMLGQKVNTLIDKNFGPGFHSINWDGKDINKNAVSSGTYLYQIQMGEFSQVKKMSLVR